MKILHVVAASLALALTGPACANALQDIVTKGSTSRSVTVDIIDSTDGTPETAVVFNTSGIDLWYRREGAARTAITEATLAALTTAYSSGGFLHVSDGTYRLDLPDAAFATGAQYVDFGGTVTGMIVIGGRVRLIDSNLEVAAIPANVTQFGGSNGTFSSGVPAVNATQLNGTAQTGRDIGASVLLSSGTGTGQLSLSSGAVLLQATQTGVTIPTVTNLTNAPTAGDFTATMKTSIGTAVAASAVASVTGNVGGNVTGSVGSVTTGGITAASFAADAITAAKLAADVTTEIQSGLATSTALGVVDDFVDDLETRLGTPSNLGGGATVAGNLSDIEAQTDDIGAAGAGLTAADDSVMSRLGTPAGASIAADIAAVDTAGEVADAVWDELQASHTTPNTFGAFLDSSVSGVSTGGVSAGDIAIAVWDLDATGHQTQGTFGQVVGDSAADTDSIWSLANTNLNATVSSRASQTSLDTVDDFVDTEVATLVSRLGTPVGASISADIAAVKSDSTAILVDTGTTLDDLVDDLETRLGTPSNLGGGATVAGNLSDIEGQTDDIGVAGAGLTAADDSVMTRLGAPAGASIAADIAAISTGGGATADEIADEVQTRTIAAVTTVNGLAANTITAAATAADFKTEVTSGLATSSDVTTASSANLAAIAALNDLSTTDIGDIVVETQGGTISLRCALAIAVAYAAGDVTTTATDSEYKDPSGTQTRIAGSAPTPGNRTATVTCPSY